MFIWNNADLYNCLAESNKINKQSSEFAKINIYLKQEPKKTVSHT